MKAPVKTTAKAALTPSFTLARKGVLQRACSCGGTPGPTGECAECRRKHGLGQEAAPTMQPKLTVNRPGDRYEQEADRVADQVMRMPEPEDVLQRDPLAGPITPLLQRQEVEEEEEELLQAKPLGTASRSSLQRQPIEEEEEELMPKAAPGSKPAVTAGVASEIDAMQGGGKPLPPSERAFFEPRIGHDFSKVRIHADGQAAQTARAVQARAFTVGSDVVFGSGQYAPGTAAGRQLLAHELTHVVQQAAAPENKEKGTTPR